MVSIQRIIGFLAREFGASDDPELNEHEEAFANELLAILHRCDREQNFVQALSKLLVNESDSFDFDELLEYFGDGSKENDPDYCDEKYFDEVEEIPVIPVTWTIHCVQFPRAEVESALAFYRSA